ncbi:MAG: hypothetical protein ACXWFZ_00235, partial [Nitrososphaeraceae archaeon]
MLSKIKVFWPVIFTISLSLVISFYLQSQITSNQEAVIHWLEQFGPYVILVYALLLSGAIIIAPIGGFPLTIAMMALFGPTKAIILSYLISCPL